MKFKSDNNPIVGNKQSELCGWLYMGLTVGGLGRCAGHYPERDELKVNLGDTCIMNIDCAGGRAYD